MSGPDQSLFDVEEMEINFGPQHPATHGVLRVKMKLDGEKIMEAKPIIGYLHRAPRSSSRPWTFRSAFPTPTEWTMLRRRRIIRVSA